MNIPPGQWRLDVMIMVLYQMALFFSAQLVFVIFLEYMPKTYCNTEKQCYKLTSKCLSDYDRNEPNICLAPNGSKSQFDECVEDKKYLYFKSAQYDYQQDCTSLTHYSASTNMYLGVLFANLVLGILADKLGRRPIYFASISIGVVSLVLSAAIPSLTAFYIFRFTTGVGVAGAQIVGWSYGSEMISAKRRFQLRTFSNWANARILLTFVAFITREWHTASYLCAAISALIFPILWKLPESPVFLEQKHKIEKANEAREQLADFCGLEYEEKEPEAINNLKKITLMDMWRNKRLRTNFLVLCFMWFYVGMATYITDLNGADMSKNLYVGQFLSGLLLTISKIAFGFAEPRFEWLGRRTVFLFSQGVAMIAYVAILIALFTDSKESTWYLIVYLCAYSFQALSTETCYLSVAELIPTDVRVTVAAITNICLRLGTILASLTKPLKFSFEPGLFLINLVVCSIGITVVYFHLEESRNVNLQNVGQDEVSDSGDSQTMIESDKKSGSGESGTTEAAETSGTTEVEAERGESNSKLA
ncbi:hypothetical protein L3Y34_017206 [Caenorhabditis briggsae]|uniref:Major facilitator superfamily (MFS) profile domain-containing protein n=1 Tax=Caenorhabditis briggsae TaxID=6238 RepID=A0AAE9DIK0_CAEBR|nr:hypothetical protein L3Y34_017206 [Caenorhabditis briggsae]